MPVSHDYKLCFIHIHKNAGSSVDNYIAKFDKRYKTLNNHWGKVVCDSKSIYLHHLFAQDIKKMFNKWDRYFKFAFVRNPWDRVVSEYFWKKRRKGASFEKMTFEKFVQLNVKYPSPRSQNSKFYPFQHQYILDSQDNVMIDFIGRYESFEKDMAFVSEKVKMPIQKLPWDNKTKRSRNYKKYYTKETKKIVSEVYRKDIELFNYKF